MSSAGQEREQELAELLKEVRALRKTIDELKGGPGPGVELPPDYAVLVRAVSALPPDYEVLVRHQPEPLRSYAVLVRAQPVQVPSYEVLVRPAIPKPEDPPIAEQ
jgi:hypothetical protein